MSHDAEPPSSQGLPLADPTPIGLICLAIGCAALVPIAFGAGLSPSGLKTAAMFCLLFGAGGQLVAGLGSLLNKNVYGARSSRRSPSTGSSTGGRSTACRAARCPTPPWYSPWTSAS